MQRPRYDFTAMYSQTSCSQNE
jgi:nuclear cap-binding protein subunit 2